MNVPESLTGKFVVLGGEEEHLTKGWESLEIRRLVPQAPMSTVPGLFQFYAPFPSVFLYKVPGMTQLEVAMS